MPIDSYKQRTSVRTVGQPQAQAPRLGSYGNGIRALSQGVADIQQGMARIQQQEEQRKMRTLQLEEDAGRVRTVAALSEFGTKEAELKAKIAAKAGPGATNYAAEFADAYDDMEEEFIGQGQTDAEVRFRREAMARARLSAGEEARNYERGTRMQHTARTFVERGQVIEQTAATNPALARTQTAELLAALDGLSPETMDYEAKAKLADAITAGVGRTALAGLIQGNPGKASRELGNAVAGKPVSEDFKWAVDLVGGDDLLRARDQAQTQADQQRREGYVLRADTHAMSLLNSHMTRAEQLRMIESEKDPEYKSVLRSVWSSAAGARDAVEADTERAQLDAFEDMAAETDMSDPRARSSLFAAAQAIQDPSTRARAIRALGDGSAQVTDIPTLYQLQDAMLRRPGEFMAADLMQFRGKLTAEDMKSLMTAQRNMRSGEASPLNSKALLNDIVVRAFQDVHEFSPTSTSDKLSAEDRQIASDYMISANAALMRMGEDALKDPAKVRAELQRILAAPSIAIPDTIGTADAGASTLSRAPARSVLGGRAWGAQRVTPPAYTNTVEGIPAGDIEVVNSALRAAGMEVNEVNQVEAYNRMLHH